MKTGYAAFPLPRITLPRVSHAELPLWLARAPAHLHGR